MKFERMQEAIDLLIHIGQITRMKIFQINA